MSEERLQKLMAHAGIASRRACEKIIEQRRVTVNGRIATLGDKADPAIDDIKVDGQRISLPESYDYYMLHKPRGVISDEDAGGNWPAARDLIPADGHLYPVGRLDVESEGLLLFTNDGDLAHKLTHPRYEHPKIYEVEVEGSPGSKTLATWRRGIVLEGRKTLPAKVEVIRSNKKSTLLRITMREGRKRQIRKVAAALGHPIHRLVRTNLSTLSLDGLPSGSWRPLTEEEIASLKSNTKKARRPRPQQRKHKSSKRSSKSSSNRGQKRSRRK